MQTILPRAKHATCKYCKAEIIWQQDEKGNWLPYNPDSTNHDCAYLSEEEIGELEKLPFHRCKKGGGLCLDKDLGLPFLLKLEHAISASGGTKVLNGWVYKSTDKEFVRYRARRSRTEGSIRSNSGEGLRSSEVVLQ